ncbi:MULTISPECIES: efflux RND transporter permease subunit [unclassified Synechococcus]|uniref:efflux RND transporter permease subunit n=1 Tax=unclassified Synechococcus TaxID=2626047 RepID=UPI0028F45FC9|nr:MULTISPECIES: efflux RND transporter permease subunit [unclassified Synechococcus]
MIATSLSLLAVFVPVAYFPGATGRIYQQFAVTLNFAVILSTFNVLSFSPSMGALLLPPKAEACRAGFWGDSTAGSTAPWSA